MASCSKGEEKINEEDGKHKNSLARDAQDLGRSRGYTNAYELGENL